MARGKLPTYDLSLSAPMPTAHPKVQVPVDPYAEGIIALGRGISQMGAGLASAMKEKKGAADELGRLNAEKSWLEFEYAETQAYNDYWQNITSDQLKGAADRYAADYDNRVRSFISSNPSMNGLAEDDKLRMDNRFLDYKHKLFTNSLNEENSKAYAFAAVDYNETVDSTILPQYQEAAKITDPAQRAAAFTELDLKTKSLLDTLPGPSGLQKEAMYKEQVAALHKGAALALPLEVQAGLDKPAIRQPSGSEGNAGPPATDEQSFVRAMKSGIQSVETPGHKNPYAAKGPPVQRRKHIDYAYGKYQVMGDNVGPWSKMATGRAVSIAEFRNSPEIQEAVFEDQMVRLFRKHGNARDAASVWFTGLPYDQAVAKGRMDQATGMSVQNYIKRVEANLGGDVPEGTNYASAEENEVAKSLWGLDAADRAKIAGDARKDLSTRLVVDQQNAIAEVANTGGTSIQLGREDFIQTYGEGGLDKYEEYQRDLGVAQDSYAIRGMPVAEQDALLASNKPVVGDPFYASEVNRYQALQGVIEADRKEREADPVLYAAKTDPNIQSQWNSATPGPGVDAAIGSTLAYQQRIGVPSTKMAVLPKPSIDAGIAIWRDEDQPMDARVGAIVNLMTMTERDDYQRLIFEQLVKAGLPVESRAAFNALERGDTGAAERLFRAVLTDGDKLPGKSQHTDADINETVQTEIMSSGSIGDAVYGIGAGQTQNDRLAIADATLMSRAVKIELRKNGDDMAKAIETVKRDIFGPLKVVSSRSGFVTGMVGDAAVAGPYAVVAVPEEYDETRILAGLHGIAQERLLVLKNRGIQDPPAEVKMTPQEKAQYEIVKQLTAAGLDEMFDDAEWRNNGSDGFILVDPVTGMPVSGADGKAITTTFNDVLKVGSIMLEPKPTEGQQRFNKLMEGSGTILREVDKEIGTTLDRSADKLREKYNAIGKAWHDLAPSNMPYTE